MTLTYTDFTAFLKEWATYRAGEFKYFYPLKGGWELWAQADYAAYVLRKDSTYDILREVAIYKKAGQRVDWLFNDADTDKAKRIAVELKCQSFANWQAFIPGVEADIVKLTQTKIDPQFQTCTTAVMGIYFENTARNWMITNGFTEVFNNTEVGVSVKKLYP